MKPDPENLHLKSGGRCSTHNMKVLFKTAEQSKKTNVADRTSLKTSQRVGDLINKPYFKPTHGDVVVVDNDVSKPADVDGRSSDVVIRRPSPKLDPLFYFPQLNGDAYDDNDGVTERGIVLSPDVAVVTSFRRQSRNQVST